ncbi:FtsX-like permease family protein [Streptomyces sp. NPDC048567]|uniref:FtsX-like permease family protein n=1 Tax=Streptomyces sp. NPDC048567 TaxID=3365570 RepID=UPI003711F60E
MALLVALVVAVTSFTVLTATADRQRLEVRGTVAANSRGAYDLLVRPAGARSQLETQQKLVSATALSDLQGGISEKQWQRILKIPGVRVAAPVAVVGYMPSTVHLPVDVSKFVRPGGKAQLWRLKPELISERGLTKVPAANSYLYVTPQRLDHPKSASGKGTELSGQIDLVGADGGRREVCSVATGNDPKTNRAEGLVPTCGSTHARNNVNEPGAASPAATGTDVPPAGIGYVTWRFPYLVAAVDPVQEARLVGLDKAVVDGSYFAPDQKTAVVERDGSRFADIPVLLADRSPVDEKLRVEVEELSPEAAAHISSGENSGTLARSLPGAPAVRSHSVEFTSDAAYDAMTRGLGQEEPSPGEPFAWSNLSYYLSASPVTYASSGGRLAARPVRQGPLLEPDLGEGRLGDGSDLGDTAVRSLDQHVSHMYVGSNSTDEPMPLIKPVGRFDPDRLTAGQSHFGAVPLETFFPPQAEGADAESRAALKGKPLLPNGNVAGLLSVAPSMITTLSSLPLLHDSEQFSGISPQGGVNAAKPISAIRVRLDGTLGTDALSRERVRLAAEQIRTRTGLAVDITMGSSPSAVDVVDPAGKSGRPTLTFRQMWSRKGVATAIADAVDRKSLVLFLLVLGVCALFVTGATSAAVRSRRTELGVLACVGWPARKLFALVLAEVVTIGAAAGLAGAVLAVPAGALAGVDVRWSRALLALPAAVALAALASLWPALQSARSHPGEAIRPSVSARAHRTKVTGVPSLAWANVRRVPGRTALGAMALAGGVAALVMLIGIGAAFQGEVAGSLLGNAVTVQVRTTDYVAAVITALLGAASVADVLYTNIRDRAAEYALLRATGWPDGSLTRLVLGEAALTATAGAVLGAGLAVAACSALTGGYSPVLGWVAAAVAGAAVLITVACAALPARTLRTGSTAQTLAEEE